MLYAATLNKLHEMRLHAMAETFQNQLMDSSSNELAFEERFSLMVDIEWARRKDNKLKSLISKAGFRYSNACIEDIEYHADRKLDRAQIERLAHCAYISEHHNIIIMGATGSGKTYLSNAFGIAACRNFQTVKYVRLPDLLDELAIAKGEGYYQKVVKQYKKVSLLILDEWLLTPPNDLQSRDLLEIIEARHRVASTVFCSQYAIEGWHSKLGEGTLADAILDRIIHNSYKIFMAGEISMRERHGLKE
jgi:DNA replication protein DnaC